MVSCVAYGCMNRTSKKVPGLSFHRFPKDEYRKKLWIKCIKRKNWYPSEHSRICSDHFPQHMFDRTSLSVVRLRGDACPTIFEAFPAYLKQIAAEVESASYDTNSDTPEEDTEETPEEDTEEKEMESKQLEKSFDSSKVTASIGFSKVSIVHLCT